jgi:hypothetical protein
MTSLHLYIQNNTYVILKNFKTHLNLKIKYRTKKILFAGKGYTKWLKKILYCIGDFKKNHTFVFKIFK